MPGTNFPGSLDNNTTLPDPTNDTATENIHPDLHVSLNAAIKAIEAKFGIGSSTPSAVRAGDLLSTDGSGHTIWGRYAVGGDLDGFLPNPTLATIDGVAGIWAAPTVTVDAKGRIIAIENGADSPEILTTKGDLLAFSSAPNRFPVGSNGQILVADSSSAFGIKWAPAPGAGVWGLITGSITDQTDLQTALGLKVNTSTYNALVASLSVAAFSGAYNDLTGKPDLTLYLLKAGGTMTGKITLDGDPTAALHAASKQYVDGKGTTAFKQNIAPTGSINGTNTSYTLPDVYATGTLQIYLNGQRLYPGASNDYVETSGGFTMNYAPLTGDVLSADYLVSNGNFIQGTNSTIVGEAPLQTPNGSLTAFTVGQSKYVAGTLEVTINGLIQARGTDFTETTPGSGIFTFSAAPLTGDVVRCTYQMSSGASGNADTVDGFHASDSSGSTGNLVPYYGGWSKLPSNVTFSYVAANSFNIVGGDFTSIIPKGTKIKLDQTSTKYWYVTQVNYVSGTNTTAVQIAVNNDYTLANAAISNFFFSYQATPLGFPQLFNYTPTWLASTTNPTIGNGTITGTFSMIGKMLTVNITVTVGSTTSIGSGVYKWGLPVSTANRRYVGTGYMLRSGTAFEPWPTSNVDIFAAIMTDYLGLINVGGGVAAATRPWANGDIFSFQLTYEIA